MREHLSATDEFQHHEQVGIVLRPHAIYGATGIGQNIKSLAAGCVMSAVRCPGLMSKCKKLRMAITQQRVV